jgi:hypothetical protein
MALAKILLTVLSLQLQEVAEALAKEARPQLPVNLSIWKAWVITNKSKYLKMSFRRKDAGMQIWRSNLGHIRRLPV